MNKIEKGHTFRHRALRHLGVKNYLKTYFPAIWPFAERQRVKKREGDPNSVANIFHNLKLILCDYTDHWNNVFWLFRSKEVTCSHIRVISPYSAIHFNMISRFVFVDAKFYVFHAFLEPKRYIGIFARKWWFRQMIPFGLQKGIKMW